MPSSIQTGSLSINRRHSQVSSCRPITNCRDPLESDLMTLSWRRCPCVNHWTMTTRDGDIKETLASNFQSQPNDQYLHQSSRWCKLVPECPHSRRVPSHCTTQSHDGITSRGLSLKPLLIHLESTWSLDFSTANTADDKEKKNVVTGTAVGRFAHASPESSLAFDDAFTLWDKPLSS